ncbi:MAG: extracellular solute-binding protein [Methanomassiliicoccales archaeon]
MKLTTIVAIVVVVVVVAAAASAAYVLTKPKGKLTIVFSGWVSSGAEYTFDQQMVKAFNALHPNDTVVFSPITGNYYGVLSTKFDTNTAPAVMYMENDALPAYAKGGYLLNLSTYLESNSSYDVQGFIPQILNTFTYKGGIYAVPKDWSPLFIYFNKAIFNKEKVPYPTNLSVWNWTTMTTLLEQLKQNESMLPGSGSGYYPMVVGPQFARILAFMHEAGGQWINQQGNGAATNSAGLLAGIKFWYGLYHSGLAGLNSNMSAGWNGGDFATGKVAMVVSGGWTYPVVNESGSYFYNNMQALGYYHMPSDIQNGTMGFDVGLGVNSHLTGSRKWLAIQFIEYFTGPIGEKKWVSLGLALPARSSILESAAYASEQPALAYAGITEFPYTYGWAYNTTNFTPAETNAHNIIEDLFAGTITPVQAYQKILQETNTTLANSSTL